MCFYWAVLCSLLNVKCLLSNINITITILKGSKVDHIKCNVYGRWQCKVSDNCWKLNTIKVWPSNKRYPFCICHETLLHSECNVTIHVIPLQLWLPVPIWWSHMSVNETPVKREMMSKNILITYCYVSTDNKIW
jgi:hypothetical protein